MSMSEQWWQWSSTVMDARSAHMEMVWCSLGQVDCLGLEAQRAAAWWPPFFAEVVRVVKLNASAGLSGREGMNYHMVLWPTAVLAKLDEAYLPAMIESKVVDALEYSCANDFAYAGTSIAGMASGALVKLVGKNETGKVMPKTAVFAILTSLHTSFVEGHHRSALPLNVPLRYVVLVQTMSKSDHNIKTMLQFELDQTGFIDTLVKALLLGSPRRRDDFADDVEQGAATALETLALCGPGGAALRSHAVAMDALRAVTKSGTEISRKCATRALFQLEGSGVRADVASAAKVSARHSLGIC
jgi:hypothetical protein